MLTACLCCCHPSPSPLPLEQNKIPIRPNSDNCTFYFKTAHTLMWVKAKFFKVSVVIYYSQTNYGVAIVHTKTTLDHLVMYSYCTWYIAIAFIKYLTTFVKLLLEFSHPIQGYKVLHGGKHHVHSAYCFIPSAGT